MASYFPDGLVEKIAISKTSEVPAVNAAQDAERSGISSLFIVTPDHLFRHLVRSLSPRVSVPIQDLPSDTKIKGI
jgi:hypothetical protein